MEEPKIYVDSAYAMVTTKITTMIVFSFITPLVIPITIISIYSNLIVYHYLIKKWKWNIYPYESSLILMPIKMAIIGVVLAQIFLVIISICLLQNNEIINVCLFAIFMMIDLYYFVIKRYIIKCRNKSKFSFKIKSDVELNNINLESASSKSTIVSEAEINVNKNKKKTNAQ